MDPQHIEGYFGGRGNSVAIGCIDFVIELYFYSYEYFFKITLKDPSLFIMSSVMKCKYLDTKLFIEIFDFFINSSQVFLTSEYAIEMCIFLMIFLSSA